MAEEDLVGVHGQDLFLGKALLDVDGEQRLLGLAADGPLALQKEVEGKLLGDGRRTAAGADLAIPKAVPGCPQDGSGIDPAVSVEIGVLDGDDGLLQVIRNLLRLELDPLFDGPGDDFFAVVGIDVGRGCGSEGLEGVDLRHVEELSDNPSGQGARQDTGDSADREEFEQTKELLPHGR